MAAYAIGRAAAARPQHQALLVIADPGQPPSEVWTFAELEDAVLRIAGGLQAAGLKPGARILIRLENTSAYALLFFGAIAGGFVPLPTSAQLTEHEVRFLLEDSGAEAIALGHDLGLSEMPRGVRVFDADAIARMLREAPRARYADTAAEDAGLPHLHVRHHGFAQGRAARAALGVRAPPHVSGLVRHRPDDRMLHAGAFNWTFTLGTGLTDPWANGATAIIYTGEKDPALWPRLIAQTGATLFAAVPGVYRQILKYAAPSRGRSRRAAPRPDGRRSAAAGPVRGVGSAHRTPALRGARHERDIDLRLIGA